MKATNVSYIAKLDAAWFLFSFDARYIINTDTDDYVRTIEIAKISVNQTVSQDLLGIQFNDEMNINKKICILSKYFYFIGYKYICQK